MVELDKEASEDEQRLEPTPVVLIEGFGTGARGEATFQGIDDLLNQGKPTAAPARRMLVVKCGSFSSLWDRAMEIYYALKGGRVDYGEAHSRKYQHGRYGRNHEHGLYENWSEDYPLHFIAHSFGGPTVFHLQQMLGTILPGHSSMMKSISCISSPLRGTPMSTITGQMEGGGQQRFSIGWVLSGAIHLAHSTNLIGKGLYDIGADQWLGDETGPHSALRQVANYLDGKALAFSPDSGTQNMLIEAMEAANADTALCESTYYRTYATSAEIPRLLPPLAWLANKLATFDGYPDDDPAWRENDWIVPLKSQYHPKNCQDTVCLHLPPDVEEPPAIPGVWHVVRYHQVSHFGLFDYLWKLRTMSPDALFFWTSHGDWLREIDTISTMTMQEPVKADAERVVISGGRESSPSLSSAASSEEAD
ncbi:hypothetical protein PYCC9005_000868 [Savitreella phatthalungensis]